MPECVLDLPAEYSLNYIKVYLGAEAPKGVDEPILCQYGELTYRDSSDELKERFEFLTGASYDAFLKMSELSHTYRTEEEKRKYQYGRNETGNAYILSDILLISSIRCEM